MQLELLRLGGIWHCCWLLATGTQAFYRNPKDVCLASSVVMSVIMQSARERKLRVVRA